MYTFSKVGYLGIKHMIEKEKLNYSQVTIVQVSDLKNKVEETRIKRDE